MNRMQASFLSTQVKNKYKLLPGEYKALRLKIKKRRRCAMLTCLLVNLGILAILKYTNFAIGNINSLLNLIGVNSALGFFGLALPMGISFYTFQTMGYLIDVYRSEKPDAAEENIFRLALFTSFFPQMVQRPISRHADLCKTLYGNHHGNRFFNSKQFLQGLLRVLWGFFKKLVVADAKREMRVGVDYHNRVNRFCLPVYRRYKHLSQA